MDRLCQDFRIAAKKAKNTKRVGQGFLFDVFCVFCGYSSPMQPTHFHLVGVCGTAMASLAGMLKAQGHRVTGSDKAFYPPMSDELKRLGIETFEGFDALHLKPQNVA